MPEELAPGVIEERMNGKFELLAERVQAVDTKHDRQFVALDEDLSEARAAIVVIDDKVDAFKLEVSQRLSDIQLAQERGERRVLDDIERGRVSRNRWMVTTALTAATAVVGYIVDVLIK